MTISPQAQSVYKILLNSNKPLSARILAEKLNIFPHSIYRLTNELIEIVVKIGKRPFRFSPKNTDEGLSMFLLNQNDWFSQKFSQSKKLENNSESNQISLSFIKSREELMNSAAEEIEKALESVDLLRSGHEMTADVMLATKEALARKVKVRMLVQDYSQGNADQIKYWQKNGIQVRKTSLKNIRLMLFDSSTLYFMSYKHADSKQDSGVKIDYAPFAVILSRLFEEWWNKAENL